MGEDENFFRKKIIIEITGAIDEVHHKTVFCKSQKRKLYLD